MKHFPGGVLFLALFLSVITGRTQHLSYQNYNVEDGLASSIVYDIVQDKRSYIWIATEKGVSLYDGYTFQNFTTKDGLANNEIISIQEDSHNRIWFLTHSGKLSYHYRSKIYNEDHDSLLRVANVSSRFTAFLEDSRGDIWLGSITDGLVRIRDKEVIRYNNETGFDGDNIFYIWENSDQSVSAFIGGSRVVDFRGDTFSYRKIDKDFITGFTRLRQGGILYPSFDKLILLKDTLVREYTFDGLQEVFKKGVLWLSEDENENLWFGTLNEGVFGFIKEEKKPADRIKQYLPDKKVSTVLNDRSGNLWFGTIGEGVYFLPSSAKQFTTFSKQDGLTDNRIYSIAITNDGTILLGLGNGKIYRISGEQKVRQYTVRNLNTPETKINVMLVTADGHIWLGTDYGVYVLYKNQLVKQLGLGAIKALRQTGDYLLVGSHRGVFRIKLDNIKALRTRQLMDNNRIYDSRVNTIAAAGPDKFWIGHDEGIIHYVQDSLIPLPYPEFRQKVKDIKITSNGVLWIATEDNGVFVKDGQKIFKIGINEGLSNEFCTALYADSRDNMWVATSKGLNRIIHSPRLDDHYLVKSYTAKDGLVSDEVNNILVDGTMVYAITNKGLSVFDDLKLKLSTTPPPIYITGIRIGERDTVILPKYELAYDQNHIKIDFIGLSYKSEGQVPYKYKMLGIDTNWTYYQQNSITYRALSPNWYTFMVSAQNEDGFWSTDLATVKFVIRPPYWKSWWFRAILINLITCLLVGAYFFITNRIKVRERKRSLIDQKIAESELKALRTQMNPHFIFNALNSIQRFIITNDKVQASNYLSKFAYLIRSVLDMAQQADVLLQDEIKALELYLELERLRFRKKLEHEIIIDEAIDITEVKVPSMLIQPYVENAIKHGILHKKEKGRVKIDLDLKEDILVCMIEDDGVGRKKALEIKEAQAHAHQSIGMQVTKERLDILNAKRDHKVNVNIIDLYDDDQTACGTRVEIYIPIDRSEWSGD